MNYHTTQLHDHLHGSPHELPVDNSLREVNQPNKLKVKVREYDGSTPLEEYLTHFERVARINRWNEQELADYLYVALKGPALELVSTLPERDQSDYGSIVNALNRRFSTARQYSRYRAELNSCKRKSGESMPELGQRIRQLVRRAYPESSIAFQEDFAIECFKNSLDDVDLKKVIVQSKPKSLDLAVDLVDLAEIDTWLQTQRPIRNRGIQEKSTEVEIADKIWKELQKNY